jgi:DNA helicase-2/ATP-dependent DNA helicase PcrA
VIAVLGEVATSTTSAIDGLTPDQVAAVTTPSTLVAVIAGAGSGKTRVLTRRIAHRIAIGNADARHTLALTFTREAAGELRRRVRRAGIRDHVEAGTFHSIALGLLRQRWIDRDRQPPAIANDPHRLLAEVAGGIPIGALAAEASWAAARGLAPSAYVGAARAAGRRTAAPPTQIAAALEAYAVVKRRRGVVDFDDLLTLCVAELAGDPSWADTVHYRFRHLLVDEAQDLNPVQQQLVSLLDGGRGDVFLVGDPAQAIYGFNGADPDLLLDVAARFPGIEVVNLPVNHRCSPQIVAAGVEVLRADGQLRPATSARADGHGVRILAADDDDHEAALVATFIRSLDPHDVRAGHVAVLARTNGQLPLLVRALDRAHVPVRRDHLAPGSPLATAARAATTQTSASRLRAWAHDTMEVEPGIAPDERETADRRIAAAVLEFLRDQPLGDGAALRTWLATTRPFADADAAGGVDVLTFHAAKGREWPVVVVTGVESSLVPHRSASTNLARAEEARLLHVAVTRPADRLVITWAARRGGYRRQPSPLIAGIDTGDVDFVAPPPELRSEPVTRDRGYEALVVWRADAARAAGILPTELCTDRDLHAIADARPANPDDLAAATSLGRLTAGRLLPGVLEALAGVAPH